MKHKIIDCLARFGWQKDTILDFFNKSFETFVGGARACIWLKFDDECDCWWLDNGDFTSAGENVLATSYAIFPVGMPQNEIDQTVTALVAEMERKVSGAFSVRMRVHYDKRTSDTSGIRP
jgi:hypothetical protein